MSQNNTSPIIPPYKKAQVYNGANEWYVHFRYWSFSENKYLKEKIRIKMRGISQADRFAILQDVCDLTNEIIEDRNKNGIYYDEKRNTKSAIIRNFIEWAEIARKDEKLAADRRQTLSEMIFNFNKFSKKHPIYKSLYIDEITPSVIELFISYLREQTLAGKTINKYLWGIEKVSEYASRIAPEIPCLSFAGLRVAQPKNETGRFPPLTFEEKNLAFDFFRVKFPPMYLFLLHIYYSCIRPKELARLQVKHFDFKGRKIFVEWFSSKNGLSNYVQILEPLYNALIDYKVDKLDPEMYLFGTEYRPSFDPIKYSDYGSDLWNRQRKNMKMPKEKQMYGLKHTFNVDYVENNKANIDWEWLRRHNRHATIQQTQEYISDLTAYFLDEKKSVIIDHHKKI